MRFYPFDAYSETCRLHRMDENAWRILAQLSLLLIILHYELISI